MKLSEHLAAINQPHGKNYNLLLHDINIIGNFNVFISDIWVDGTARDKNLCFLIGQIIRDEEDNYYNVV
jgi:hypothetical protein